MQKAIIHIITLTIAFTCPLHAQGQTSINFAGSINFGHNEKTPSDSLFVEARNITGNGNLTFSTLATTFIDKQQAESRMPLSKKNIASAHPDQAKLLVQNGFTAMSAANGHIGGYGFEGLASTTDALRKNNITFAGIRSFCETSIIEHKGDRIGFASFGNTSYTPSMTDSAKVTKTISRLDSTCQIVVIAFSMEGHHQSLNQNKSKPHNKVAETFAKTCIDAGADIVYGDGEKTLQHMELYKERIIMYGLGNFCTPNQTKYNAENGCAPVITVTTFADGTFRNAQIHSFVQTDKNGPQKDQFNNAVKIIREKTLTAIPHPQIVISDDGTITPTTKSSTALVHEVIAEGRTHMGKRYRRGAVGPDIFDCSGFTSYIFRKIGIELHRTSRSQYQQGDKVDRDSLLPGDLVFFRGSASRQIGHVGVVVSVDKANRTFKFIHASNRGVVIDDFAKSSYYIRRYVGATRIIGNIPPH